MGLKRVEEGMKGVLGIPVGIKNVRIGAFKNTFLASIRSGLGKILAIKIVLDGCSGPFDGDGRI